MNSYPAGTLVTVATYTGPVSDPAGGFRDTVTGALADPLIVLLKYRISETGAWLTITYPDSRIIRDAMGLYRSGLDTTGSSDVVWTYLWDGIGGVQALALNAFVVRDPYS